MYKFNFQISFLLLIQALRKSFLTVTLTPAPNKMRYHEVSRRFFFSYFLFKLIRSSCVRFVYLFSLGSNFWVTNCCCTALVEGAVARDKNEEKRVGGGRDGCFVAPSARRYVTPAWRYFARRCGGSTREAMRTEKGVGRWRRSINIKLSVQHLPTSVVTRATTRPARCSRIDFANTMWKTATCSFPSASKFFQK